MSREKSWWTFLPDEEKVSIGQAHTVFETDKAPVKSGLLDKDGNPLVHEEKRIKMGFLPDFS